MNKINDIQILDSMKKIKQNNSFGPKNKNNKSKVAKRPSKTSFTHKIMLPINNYNNNISIKKNNIKENSKKSEIKANILSSFNKKAVWNKLKIKRRKSKSILSNPINEEQKEMDRNAILERIKNREINHELNRKINDSASKTNKIINTNQTEIQKTLNDIKIVNKSQQNKFCFYHIYNSNHLFFYIPNSQYEEIKVNPKPNSNYQILVNLTLPQAFRPRMNYFGNIPKCIIQACSKGNLTMIKNFETCNLIWKLLTFDKMRLLTKNLFPYQKFNHFPCTYQLGRKDNLFKHYKHFKRLFPDLYNYMPMTFILPNDSDNFEYEYKKNKKNIWIAKPVNMSRGRFIKLIYNHHTYKKLIEYANNSNNIQYLISKYLDKPHLLNNKKYDLRIYVIVLSFTPLKIYLYYNGLVRFATEDYIKDNYDNIYIHLTNYSINKQNPNYKKNLKDNKEIAEMEEIEEDNEQNDDSSKWSLVEYRNFFKKEGNENNFEKIWKQIEDIVIKTMINVTEVNSRDLSGNKNNNVFELYGFDIFVDEKFKVWLLEVNVNPSLHCTSPLDLSIKTDLIVDIFNLIGIVPFNHNNNEEVYNIERKKNNTNFSEFILPKINQNNKINYEIKSKGNEKVDEYYKKIIENFMEEKMRSELTGFELIFPKKNNVEFYSKILKDSKYHNEANNVLWNFVLNNE